jgi:glucose/arabinose dehydrogenase
MTVHVTRSASEALGRLPTQVRPKVDPADVVVPEGFQVEAVIAGLSFPTGMGFADDGSLFLLEGGSTWPTRPYLPARVLRFHPDDGRLDEIAVEVLGGPRGVAYRDGAIYVSVKGGYYTHIDRYDLQTGERTVVVDGLPNGGWHEPGGPVFGPDGLMYFAQGSVSQNGVALPSGFTVDLAKHPKAHDVPGQDVTLTGNNVWSRDPIAPFPFLTQTGAFKPFGVPARRGEVVEGQLKCSSGLWRSRPDGSDMELLAWGLRNPYGMAFSEDGDLYVSDNDYEEKGERAVAHDPDRIWRIGNVRQPFGSVRTPEWYGFPDYAGDGLPVWHETHVPAKGNAAEPLIENPPPMAGPAVHLAPPHSCMTKMDFCRSNEFGYRGRLFQCMWGTLAPLNSPHREDLAHGFNVTCVDVTTGESEPFLRNPEPGAASGHPGRGGVERPVDCKFAPDGRSLYVLDFGAVRVTEGYMLSYGHTGVLWRVTRR